MEAEDIQKMAARINCKEADLTLALQVAKDDVAEAEKLLSPTVSVVKGCYAAKTNRLNGGFIIIIFQTIKKIHRVRAMASYDAEFGNIPLNQPWDQIEKKIIEAQVKQNCVPAISQDLTGEIDFSIKENMAEIIPILTSNSADDMNSRIRRIVCTSLGDSDVDVNCEIETISLLTLKITDHEIAPPGEAPPAEGVPPTDPSVGESTASSAPGLGITGGREITLKTDVILSPVAGTPVSSLNVGDFILVKIIDTRPQASYVANLLRARDGDKNIPVRVPIKKIERTESQRLVVITEFGPGVYGKTVVQEGLKIKVEASDTPSLAGGQSKMPSIQMMLFIVVVLLVLGLLVVAVWYFANGLLS